MFGGMQRTAALSLAEALRHGHKVVQAWAPGPSRWLATQASMVLPGASGPQELNPLASWSSVNNLHNNGSQPSESSRTFATGKDGAPSPASAAGREPSADKGPRSSEAQLSASNVSSDTFSDLTRREQSRSLSRAPTEAAGQLEDHDSPEQSVDQIQVMYQIQKCRSLPDLEFIVLRHGASLDALNVSAAIAKLPHLQASKSSARNRRRLEQVVGRLLPSFRAHLAEYGARQVSTCIWALAKLDVAPGRGFLEALVKDLCAQQGAKLSQGSAQDLCTLATGLSWLGYQGASVWRLLGSAARTKLGELNPQGCANLLSAFARAGVASSALFEEVVRRWCSDPSAASSLSGRNIANMLWACAKVRPAAAPPQHQPRKTAAQDQDQDQVQVLEPSANTLSSPVAAPALEGARGMGAAPVALAPATPAPAAAPGPPAPMQQLWGATRGLLLQRLWQCTATDLARLGLALARLGERDPVVWGEIGRAVPRVAASFRPEEVCTLGQALRELGLRQALLLEDLAAIACTRIEAYRPHHVAQLLQVFKALDSPQPQLAQAVARVLAESADEASSAWSRHKGADVASTLDALLAMGQADAQVCNRLASLAAAAMQDYSLKEVALVMSTFQAARYSHAGLLSAAVLRLMASLQELQQQQAAAATAATAATSAVGDATSHQGRRAAAAVAAAVAEAEQQAYKLQQRQLAAVSHASSVLYALADLNFHNHDALQLLQPHMLATADRLGPAELAKLYWAYCLAGHPGQLMYHSLLHRLGMHWAGATADAGATTTETASIAAAAAAPGSQQQWQQQQLGDAEKALVWQGTVALLDMLTPSGADAWELQQVTGTVGNGAIADSAYASNGRAEGMGAQLQLQQQGGSLPPVVQQVLRSRLPVDAAFLMACRQAEWQEQQRLWGTATATATATVTGTASATAPNADSIALVLRALCQRGSSTSAIASGGDATSASTGEGQGGAASWQAKVLRLLRGQEVQLGGETADGAVLLPISLPGLEVCIELGPPATGATEEQQPGSSNTQAHGQQLQPASMGMAVARQQALARRGWRVASLAVMPPPPAATAATGSPDLLVLRSALLRALSEVVLEDA